MNILIMAGGRGERFWPLSSSTHPKQMLPIVSSKSLITETVERFKGFVDESHIFISTNEALKSGISRLIPQIPLENFILEPEPKDTAAAIGLGAVFIQKREPGSVMAVMPADHFIQEKEKFLMDLQIAERIARETGCLVTFGIEPVRPETGFGYIELGEVISNSYKNLAYEVRSFREKPDLEKAKEYISKANFVWNSGMFIWSTSAILEALEKYMPDLHSGLMEIQDHLDTKKEKEVIQSNFNSFKKISIDYGVMEKADNVLCLKATFPWDDVGAWTALERFNKKDENGNIIKSDWKGLDTKDSIMFNENGLICTLGVHDLLIIRNGDIVLVADKEREQEIKKIIEDLRSDEDLKKYIKD